MEKEGINWFSDRISNAFNIDEDRITIKKELIKQPTFKAKTDTIKRYKLTDEERLIKNRLHSLNYYYSHKEKCLKRRREWGERNRIKAELRCIL